VLETVEAGLSFAKTSSESLGGPFSSLVPSKKPPDTRNLHSAG